MLRPLPGAFVAGERLDWVAPMCGYLLQASLSTGAVAARSVLAPATHDLAGRTGSEGVEFEATSGDLVVSSGRGRLAIDIYHGGLKVTLLLR